MKVSQANKFVGQNVITPDSNPPVEQWDGTDVEPTFRFATNGGSTTPTTPSNQQT